MEKVICDDKFRNIHYKCAGHVCLCQRLSVVYELQRKETYAETQNKITAKELEKHLDEYLDKVENGEKVFVEYDGELYTIVKIEKE